LEGSFDVINFVFEDVDRRQNFVQYVDPLDERRFAPSAIAGTMKNHRVYSTLENFISIDDATIDHCIIPVGVIRDPNFWAGADYYKDNIRDSMFDCISPKILERVKHRRALLLFDQCLEGYQTPWLWQFFHEECERVGIHPSSVIYVTGNVLSFEQYNAWANARISGDRIKVVPYTHFERDIGLIAHRNNIQPTYESIVKYKQENITTVKTFNCLNKRPRAHRSWFYLKLYKENLLSSGLVSMNDYGPHIPRIDNQWPDQQLMLEARKLLPLVIYNTPNNEKDDLFYITRITDQVFLDSWLTVIPEASFADSSGTLFISEKTFKPIACMHPFIVFGNRGSLKELRSMGYKTFSPFINEEYDDLPTFERMDAIIAEIKRIDAIPDKFKWLYSMKDILEHNYKLLHSTKDIAPSAHTSVFNYYNNFFNLKVENV
jgi:hypothetical protein